MRAGVSFTLPSCREMQHTHALRISTTQLMRQQGASWMLWELCLLGEAAENDSAMETHL